MEEQEGINLETINSVNDDSVILSANGDDAEDVVNNDVPDNTNLVDEEKESLKRGLNAERKARKEAEKKNKEFETRLLALEKANEPKEKTTLEELVENGVDEDIAKSIAGAIDKRQSNTSKVENELRDMKFRYELSEKSKDDNFSDILDFEDEIKSLVGKGLTIEQSYYALNYKNLKSINTKSEIERKVEAKLQNNQTRKEILGNINSSEGGSIQNNESKPKATSTEVQMARLAGIDIDDYLAAKNSDSIKQYDSYLKRKG